MTWRFAVFSPFQVILAILEAPVPHFWLSRLNPGSFSKQSVVT